MEFYQRTWAEISLDHIQKNLDAAKARLKPETRIMCVIKADGYGHGAAVLAQFLAPQCDYFAVAILEEALTLRSIPINKQILLLGYTSPSQYATAIKAHLTLTIFSIEQARELSRVATELGVTAVVHVAVDTGMSRIGFVHNDDFFEQLLELRTLKNLLIEGIFSHFAAADSFNKQLAKLQYQHFEEALKSLKMAGFTVPLRHICNSAGLMEFTDHYDMVRFGISLYGLYPSEEVNRENLKIFPALQWKTRIVQLKTVPPDTGIGYGHSFVTARETRVATLPIGYADGFPRALSNRGRVLIRGEFAPILGRICMDQCMVDVTKIPNLEVEEEVVLIGSSKKNILTIEEISGLSGSFNYEMACRIGARVPRLYFYQDSLVQSHNKFITEGDFLCNMSNVNKL